MSIGLLPGFGPEDESVSPPLVAVRLELMDGRRDAFGVLPFSATELVDDVEGGTVDSRSRVWSILVIAFDFALRWLL